MKREYKEIYARMRALVTAPAEEWARIFREPVEERRLMVGHLIPCAAFFSAVSIPVGLINHSIWQAAGTAFIHFTASAAGTYAAYRLVQEYMRGKMEEWRETALPLTVYSAEVFIAFRSIGAALGNVFVGQLFMLASLFFIHILYVGVQALEEVPGNQRTNLLVIASLSIISLPTIIHQVLAMLFGMTAGKV